ncbi:unnamed protein product [Heterobilharzia americana]|nr:unnamed protein product [Heterobilharzia americana]
MTEDTIKDLAKYKLNAEMYENKYHQAEYEKEKFREEARLGKKQLELTENALKDANEKIKEYRERIKKFETDLHTYELLKHRSQAAVVGLQKVARESQDNVIQLETRLRNLVASQSSEQEKLKKKLHESETFLQELGRRIGLSEVNTDFHNVMEKVAQRLDEAALFEVKYVQSDSNLHRVIAELDSVKQSTHGLTKRGEDYLQERKVLSEKINLLEAKNQDLASQLKLMRSMSQAKETITNDLRGEIEELKKNKQIIEEKHKQATFKLQVESAQMKALLTSLSASLSTIDNPCEPTEIGVKQSVARCLDQIVQMREAGNNFQNKVLELQNQFEAQHKAGLAVNVELKQARERAQQAETDCAQMKSELSGLRILNKQDHEEKEKVKSLIIQLREYLGLQLDHQEVTITEMISACLDRTEYLLNRGCLPWVCVQSSENKTPEEYECDHQQVEHLSDEVIKRQGDLSLKEWRSIEKLCKLCSGKLIKSFCNQLNELFGQTAEMHQANKQIPKCNDHMLVKLQQELEAKQLEVNDVRNHFEVVREDRDKQIDDLNKTIEKLNVSLKSQKQKSEKLQKLVEQQNSKSQNKQEAFKMAKSLLVDAHNKKKKLGTFRDLIGRMVDVDTRFTPNPDMVIFQRLQQLIDFAVSKRLTSVGPDAIAPFNSKYNTNTLYPVQNSLGLPINQLKSAHTANLALPSWEQNHEANSNLHPKYQGKSKPLINGTLKIVNEQKPISSQNFKENQPKNCNTSVSDMSRKSTESRLQKDDRQY